MPLSRPRIRWTPCLVASVLLASPIHLAAQGTAKCTAPEFRQFDFWAGDWVVTIPQGQRAGTNRIEVILGGCALQEHWTSAGGGDGTSLNMWNAADGKWHQVWMDAGGNMLELAGKLEGESMVMSSVPPAAGADSARRVDRITWTPVDEGKVRQLWESSTDGGLTWSTQFDGLYVRQR